MGRLLSAAREEFNERGFTAATTAAIARRAEITEAQLFRYFASKTELFREAVFTELNRHFAEFQSRHGEQLDATGDVRALSARYIADLQKYFRESGKLLLSAIVAHIYKSADVSDAAGIGSLTDYFAMGAAELARRSGEDGTIAPNLIVRISFAAVLATSLLRRWLFPDGLAGDEEIDAAVADFVVEGIGGNQPDSAAQWTRPAGKDSTASSHGLALQFLDGWAAGELPDELLTETMSAWTTTSGHMDKGQYRLGIRLTRSIFADRLACEIRSITAEADRVIVEANASGMLLDGDRFENRYVFALMLFGGKIASLREYLDPEPVRARILPLLRSAIGRLEV